MPAGFARERLGVCLDIASYQQGGRVRLAQDGLARNKRRSGFSREAPRGRRSISQALNVLWRTPPNPTTIYRRAIAQPKPNHNNTPYRLTNPANLRETAGILNPINTTPINA